MHAFQNSELIAGELRIKCSLFFCCSISFFLYPLFSLNTVKIRTCIHKTPC